MPKYYTEYFSVIGNVTLICDDDAMIAVLHEAGMQQLRRDYPEAQADDTHPLLLKAKQEIDAYLSGELKAFTLPLKPKGTDFQQKIFRKLKTL